VSEQTETTESPEPAERSPKATESNGEHRNIFSRFGHFLQASWRELHRVQWPDRRHVAQATGIVVGFVAITGGYLGLADYLSSKFVDLIL
jgi:preprotein translocase SecE subunit